MIHHQVIGNGPPVLLLPGLLGTVEEQWGKYIQPITGMGYSVIAADLPGHGQSEMTKSLTMRVIVEEIDRLLTAIHAEPVVILGFSLGAYAGLSYALKNRNRVVGLWLHAMKFYWSGAEAEGMAAELDLAYLEEHKPERLARLKEIHGEAKLEAMLPWLNKLVTGLPDSGLTELELEDYEVPTVVSVGDRDVLIPVSEAADLYGAMRECELCVFPDTPHEISGLRDHVFLPLFKDFLNRLE